MVISFGFEFATLSADLMCICTVGAMIQGTMFMTSDNLKIGNVVVRFIAIYVMNMFCGEKFSSKMLFHDKPMFVGVSAVAVHTYDTVISNFGTTFIVGVS